MRSKGRTTTLDPSTTISQMENFLFLRISIYHLSNLIQSKKSTLHETEEGRESQNVEKRKASEVL